VDTLTTFGFQEMPGPVLASQEELRSMAFVLTTLDVCLVGGGVIITKPIGTVVSRT
jgi:hypothetical protein